MKQLGIQYVCVYFLCIFASVDAHKRTKRILGGRPLWEHQFYNTQFAVSLQNTHACASEQIDHTLLECRNTHFCTGSLITADFVMTACHCLTFDKWYANREPPPLRKNLTLGDLPPYLDDRIHNRPRKQGDPLVHRRGVSFKHTLHNDIAIFAGHPSLKRTPQRRHAAKLFVHHLCGDREAKDDPELWVGDFYEIDIGLVKTCFPFHLNEDVQLAPLKPLNKMEEHLHRMVDISATCLFVGWGFALNRNMREIPQNYEKYRDSHVPDVLQHTFRYIACNSDCSLDRHACIICTRHHGAKSTILANGDSGSPLICDGFFTAVHSRGFRHSAWVGRNFTIGEDVAVACVKDFISEGHLSYLRSLTHRPFHYINGEPVTGL